MASLCAYFAGEFSNAITLAKMKIWTEGKWLWTRTIGSTVGGEFVDTALFIVIAFYGVLPRELFLSVLFYNYFFKVGLEVVLTPVTVRVVHFLKREEQEDVYDRGTQFNPFGFGGR